MAYSEKDLFLVLTVICLLVVIYLIVNLWRSAGKSKPQAPVRPKRVERIRRAPSTPAPDVVPKFEKTKPVCETPRLPQAALVMNEKGNVIATVRATDERFVIGLSQLRSANSDASLEVLHQYFKFDDVNGVIVQRTTDETDSVARSMTIIDQKGNVLIQTVPVDFSVKSWPDAQRVDLQSLLYAEICGLYRREFLQRMTWQTQAFLLRLERSSLHELLQVPLHPSIARPLMLLLVQRLIESDNYWEKCAVLNRVEGALEKTSFENQFDGTNLKQRINLHSFALSQTSNKFMFIRSNRSDWTLSL